MALRWLFLDMNAYFASVEQQEHPELRGKPIAVVPIATDSTCCIAVSYEAKHYGIKTGTNVGEARRLCPNLRLVEAKHGPYRAYHDRIKAVVEDCIPITKILSVDEMVCRLCLNERDPVTVVRLALKIKEQIQERVGECLKCSVGIGPNPFIAKVAAELWKPDGLVILDECDLPSRLLTMRLTDFPGINCRMEARFHRAGVRTTEQMYALSMPEMKIIWGGIVGERWWRHLRGQEVMEVPTKRGSVSHSHVLEPELRTRAGGAIVIARLLQKAAERLRHLGFYACGLSVFARGEDRQSWSAKVRFTPCQDTWTLMHHLRSLWEHSFRIPVQVGLVLYDLLPVSGVPKSLFEQDRRRERASQAVDQLNHRFGRDAIYLGCVPKKYQHEEKIAFGKINELEPASHHH